MAAGQTRRTSVAAESTRAKEQLKRTTPGLAMVFVAGAACGGSHPVEYEVDGGRTHRLHLPPKAPAKDFRSLVLCDNQTCSMLQTDQRFPSLSSQRGALQSDDGSSPGATRLGGRVRSKP